MIATSPVSLSFLSEASTMEAEDAESIRPVLDPLCGTWCMWLLRIHWILSVCVLVPWSLCTLRCHRNFLKSNSDRKSMGLGIYANPRVESQL